MKLRSRWSFDYLRTGYALRIEAPAPQAIDLARHALPFAEGQRLIFNAAKSAVNTATWRPYYRHLCGKGFSPTEAILIIARRMLRIAFAMFKQKTNFDPNKVPKPLT